MPDRGIDRLLADLGVSEGAERVWRALIASPHLDVLGLSEAAAVPCGEVEAALTELVDTQLARAAESASGYLAFDPVLAVEARIAADAREHAERAQRLAELQARLPALSDEHALGRATIGLDRSFEVVLSVDEVRKQIYLAGEHTERDLRTIARKASAAGIRDSLQHDVLLYERGVRARTIVATDQLAEPDLYDALATMSDYGDAIRSMPDVPTSVIIWDASLAVLPLNQDDPTIGAMFIRDRTVVDLLARVFDHFWVEASPVFAAGGQPTRPSERSRRVLELIVAGATDAAIARSLGIGVRTIRRDVADLRTLLSVNSRTEIVPAAIRRGWL